MVKALVGELGVLVTGRPSATKTLHQLLLMWNFNINFVFVLQIHCA